jgi:peptidyl-prolyl cis-trans isomerase C
MRRHLLTLLLIVSSSLSSCSTPTARPTATNQAVTPSETVVSVTATPEVPLAAVINSEGIPEDFYQAELSRYKTSHPESTEVEASKAVLDDLINTILLAQGAASAGYVLDDAGVDSKIQVLRDQLGGDDQLQTWMTAHQYSEDQFRFAIRISSAAAWMRDKINKEVPVTGDEVHLRQILFTEEANAQSVLQEVRSGADFATLAEQYDPITRGDIGWFPRGYLTQAKVEEAAFALQPGEVSEVISSDIGYHLIQVIERDGNHTLAPDAYQSAQKKAVIQWLAKQKESSQIEIRSQ